MLLVVHSARTLTVPFRLSSSRFCFLMRHFLSRELKISFDAQAGAMSLLGHRTFSLFAPSMRSERPSRARIHTVSNRGLGISADREPFQTTFATVCLYIYVSSSLLN